MLSKFLLGLSLMGAEWILYLLLAISIYSIAVIMERFRFFKAATKDAEAFRNVVRDSISAGHVDQALAAAKLRLQRQSANVSDFDARVTETLIHGARAKHGADALADLSADAMLQTRNRWEKNLSVLATIGSNAPFVGLFGTVLGIIQAFHDLSTRSGGAAGMQTMTAGISEALIATAVGILVAIPAVVAFNLFQRRLKQAANEAEALRSFLMAHLAGKH
jgi:biopolymer transport protein ExbB